MTEEELIPEQATADVIFVPADMFEGGLLALAPREEPDEVRR